MSKGLDAIRAQRSDLSPPQIEAGMLAYRTCVFDGIAPPFQENQVRELVLRIYRAMRDAG
jgi:hypothetical protein